MAKLILGNFLRRHADRSPRLLRLLWALEGGLVSGLAGLTARLSPERASRMGRRLLQRLGPRLDKSRIIRWNLTVAFPEKSAAEIEALVPEVWGTLGALLGEYPHISAICDNPDGERVEFEDRSGARAMQPGGPPAVFVSAHLANWEIVPGILERFGKPATVVYTPLQNPRLDRMLRRAREDSGIDLVGREGAVRPLMRALREGRSVGLVVDQRVDSGEPLPFFGHDKLSSTAPAMLALRMGVELIPVQVQRRGDARFRIIIHPPVQADSEEATDEDRIRQMSRRLNRVFEDWIRERPGEWVCTKRRWPKTLQLPGN
ncbi:MAG TPA: lauroyl acyltransferase [Gammaproteobacteria bacterium]|nr:lauroyl acyltransferase [Gammaproteobacteria bacterium]